MELTQTTEYYPIGATLASDVNNWTIKDTNVAGVVYYGYTLNLGASTASAVWRIRKETTTTNVTTVTYADGDGLYDNVWNNRASLNYK